MWSLPCRETCSSKLWQKLTEWRSRAGKIGVADNFQGRPIKMAAVFIVMSEIESMIRKNASVQLAR